MPTESAILLNQYNHQVRTSKAVIYHFSRGMNGRALEPWYWPVDYAGLRFSPSDLVVHRTTHEFSGPGCLCPLLDPQLPDFVESAIYLSMTGTTSGEYVASCAYGVCGYFVFLERLFDKVGLPLKRYPARAPFENPPLPIELVVPEKSDIVRVPLKRTYAMLDVTGAIEDVPTYAAPARYKADDWELWTRLDAWSRPGLTGQEYRRLLRCNVKCRLCGLIMTERRFYKHTCLVMATEDVDTANEYAETEAGDTDVSEA